jgi:hypothetical protein
MTLAEALEAQRLAQEAVAIACKAMDEAERDMNEAYAVLDRANRAVARLKKQAA